MNAQHHDIMRYLGGMNLACVVVAALRLLAVYRLRKAKKITPENSKVDQALDKLAFASLLAGNASQAALNFTVARRSGRWVMGHGFDSISEFVLSTKSNIVYKKYYADERNSPLSSCF